MSDMCLLLRGGKLLVFNLKQILIFTFAIYRAIIYVKR